MKAPKRNWWWLLAPVLAGLLLILVLAVRYSRQTAAIGHIEKLGGRVLTTHGERDWLLRWTGGRSFGFFQNATLVNLSETTADDSDLVFLKRLGGLERLNLSETNITDKGLKHLGRCTDLKALDLTDTRITGAGLTHLRPLTRLEYLYLQGTQDRRRRLALVDGVETPPALGCLGNGGQSERFRGDQTVPARRRSQAITLSKRNPFYGQTKRGVPDVPLC